MSADPPVRPAPESLEVILPEGGELQRRACRVAEFARTLTDGSKAAPVADPVRARTELEEQRATRAGIALEDLLVHHLGAHVGGEGFAWFGRPHGGHAQAWRMLEDLREGLGDLPAVPAPGEPPLLVAGRLLDGLFHLGWSPARRELWRARLEHAAGGPERGEAAFRERLDEVEERGGDERVHAALLAGLVESLLDRGAVRDARLALEDHLPALGGDRRLARLHVWVRLLGGDLEEALRLARAAGPWEGTIPDALVELREGWPAALPALSGRPARVLEAPRPRREEAPLRSRRALGASVLGVFAFRADRSAEPLLLDVAPGLRSRVESWLVDREDACCVPSRPEHRLVIEAAPVRAHGTRPVGALGDGALALALAPVLDGEGEVAGWLHVECEHHLVPARARLEELARGWRLPLLRRGIAPEPVEVRVAERVLETTPRAAHWGRGAPGSRPAVHLDGSLTDRERELVGEVFEGLVAGLGVKTAQRGWWGFVAREGELQAAASGGETFSDPGGARALDRCLATRGAVSFDEPDPRLSISRESASGLVLPLVSGGELVGALALESRRRRDFRPEDVDRHPSVASAFALPLRLACFRAWHLERFGFDLFFDTSSPAFRSFAEPLEVAGRSPSPVVLSGPPGSGKMVFARWIHWIGGRGAEPLEVLGARVGADGEALLRRLEAVRERGGRGSLVLDDVEGLSAARQAALLDHLEGIDRGGAPIGGEALVGPRLIATSSRPLARSVEAGELRADLAARLDRLQIFVPPLADRRSEIPALARFLASRFAEEEGCRPPRFTDEALALLWRQSWPGNLRELESLLFKLVLLHPDEEVGAEEIGEVGRRFRFVLVAKLPTKRPRREDVVAAMRTTFKAETRFNKRRAARYLGWDPDTLVVKLGELGISEEGIGEEPMEWR